LLQGSQIIRFELICCWSGHRVCCSSKRNNDDPETCMDGIPSHNIQLSECLITAVSSYMMPVLEMYASRMSYTLSTHMQLVLVCGRVCTIVKMILSHLNMNGQILNDAVSLLAFTFLPRSHLPEPFTVTLDLANSSGMSAVELQMPILNMILAYQACQFLLSLEFHDPLTKREKLPQGCLLMKNRH